jgi:hypothetical protein
MCSKTALTTYCVNIFPPITNLGMVNIATKGALKCSYDEVSACRGGLYKLKWAVIALTMSLKSTDQRSRQ